MMMGLGKEKRRDLPKDFSGTLPNDCTKPMPFLPGTLVVEGNPYEENPDLAKQLAGHSDLAEWPVIVLVDSTDQATANMQEFLWTLFTRFEPAADIHSADTSVHRFHVGLTPPIVFDSRMKPWYTDVLEVDTPTRELVDRKITKMIPAHWR